MFVHLAPADAVSKIKRNGIRRLRKGTPPRRCPPGVAGVETDMGTTLLNSKEFAAGRFGRCACAGIQ